MGTMADSSADSSADDAQEVSCGNKELATAAEHFPQSFQTLPPDVFNIVLKLVVGQHKCYPCTLFNLAQVDSWLAERLRHACSLPVWKELWQLLTSPAYIGTMGGKRRCTDKRLAEYTETQSQQHTGQLQHPRDLIRLACFHGCMLCNNKVAFISWKYMVRCCEACLASNTVKEVDLVEQLRLPKVAFQHLPHRTVQYRGARSLRCKNSKEMIKCKAYFKPHVVEVLRLKYGVESFEAYMHKHVMPTVEEI